MTRHRSRACVKPGQSELGRISGRVLRWLSIAAALAWLHVLPAAAEDKQTLIWLLRDLPPLTIFEGSQKHLGAVDQLMPLLIASLPQYRHDLLRVNRARGMQMLLEPSFTCDPSLLWNPERAKRMVYSIPAYRIRSNGVAIRRKDHAALSPFLIDNQVDLERLLASKSRQLGVVAERSYGEAVDRILSQAPPGRLTAHYGNDALGSLLQMQRLGRLTSLLGYWPEIRYQALQQGIAHEELEFFGIHGNAKYQSIHVACSDTPEGRQAISAINATIRQLRHNRLIEFYAQWLDPQMRSEYLRDAEDFFQDEAPE